MSLDVTVIAELRQYAERNGLSISRAGSLILGAGLAALSRSEPALEPVLKPAEAPIDS